jgi:serine/threonine-protein kinase ATR
LLGKEENIKVKRSIPFTLGFLSCFYGSCSIVDGPPLGECKLFIDINNEKHGKTTDYLQGFWCSKCDRSIVHNHKVHLKIRQPPDFQSARVGLNSNFPQLQSLFFKLLYDESSEEVQVACVRIIRRILVHGSEDILIKTKSEWIKCVEFLLLNKKKALREAFCTRISSFLESPVLSCLFLNGDSYNKTNEQKFLGLMKHALSAAEDPQIFETLLECVSQIMIAVDIHSQLFLSCLILLVDQLDHPHVTVRMSASRLIHKSCYFHLKGGFELILSKVVHIRNELFDYLTMRFTSHPKMVREFAEAVFGVETEELVEKMIPIVLPKLVVSQQDNNRAVQTLFELAKCLNTDMVPLIVNWLPKVLAFALHRADKQELLSTLQFYHDQIGSDNQEIFAAALPALLDELVCFLDGGDSVEINQRYGSLNLLTINKYRTCVIYLFLLFSL